MTDTPCAFRTGRVWMGTLCSRRISAPSAVRTCSFLPHRARWTSSHGISPRCASPGRPCNGLLGGGHGLPLGRTRSSVRRTWGGGLGLPRLLLRPPPRAPLLPPLGPSLGRGLRQRRCHTLWRTRFSLLLLRLLLLPLLLLLLLLLRLLLLPRLLLVRGGTRLLSTSSWPPSSLVCRRTCRLLLRRRPQPRLPRHRLLLRRCRRPRLPVGWSPPLPWMIHRMTGTWRLPSWRLLGARFRRTG